MPLTAERAFSASVQNKRRYPPKALLGAAHEFATGKRLDSTPFEWGESGAVKVFENLGHTIAKKTI